MKPVKKKIELSSNEGRAFYVVSRGETSLIDRIKGKQWLILTLCSTVDNQYRYHDIALREGDLLQIDTTKHPAIMHLAGGDPQPPKTLLEDKL